MKIDQGGGLHSKVWTDLDLVGYYFDATVDDSLHMFCVEVAETEMFHPFVLLEVLKGSDILVVIVLFKCSSQFGRYNGMLYLVRETHKLPMELQQVDTLRGQPSTALVYIRPDSFLRDLHRVEDAVLGRREDRVRVRARGPVSALLLLT